MLSAVRLDAGRKPRSGPARPGTRRAPPARPPHAPRVPPRLLNAAWVRRRPIGAVIADICRDLGIGCSHPLWRELQRAIISESGNYARLVSDIIDRATRLIAEAWPAGPRPAALAPVATGPP